MRWKSEKPRDGSNYLDFMLLNTEIWKLLTEKCILLTALKSAVCSHIVEAIERIKGRWGQLVNVLVACHNLYLCRSLQKVLATQFFLYQEPEISEKLKKLVDIAVQMLDKGTANIIPVFKEILIYNVEKQHACHRNHTAVLENFKHHCKGSQMIELLSLNEVKYQCCLSLMPEWDHILAKLFSIDDHKYCKNMVMMEVLDLWEAVIGEAKRKNHMDLFPVFLSSAHVNSFLRNWAKTDRYSFKVYVDIMLQILSCRTGSQKVSTEELDKQLLLDFVMQLSFKGVIQQSSFVISTSSDKSLEKCSKAHQEYDIVLFKKVISFIFSAIDGSQDVHLIQSVVDRIEEKILPKMGLTSGIPASVWVPKLFLDHDDLLLNTMQSLLNIYTSLGLNQMSADCSTSERLRLSLNPHGIFLSFLKKIGNDHSVLLEFLMSNETCILAYLLQYLKLLLIDWDSFTESYEHAIRYASLEDLIHTSEDPVNSGTFNDTVCDDTKTGNDSCIMRGTNSKLSKMLVSYSDSESSDNEENSSELGESTEKLCASDAINIFKDLRTAIQRLSDCGQFPYNARPLVDLLRKCEDKCR